MGIPHGVTLCDRGDIQTVVQRFVNIRFRRYLTQRSKGRGFGWKRFPNSKLYAMGLAYIGSGMLEYTAKPAHGV